MKMLKKLLLGYLFLSLTMAVLPAYAITPQVVAVLPVINTARYRYPEDLAVIQNTIIKPFKYPYYTLLPLNTTADAASMFLQNSRGRKLSEQKVMAELADALSADIVVVVELSRIRLDRIYSRNYDDTYICSDVSLTGFTYAKATKKYDRLTAVKSELESESIDTNAPAVLQELTEEILVKMPYKRIPVSR
ncbi:hypothetical protein [Sporomusa aerivorans]|uniref:hypothetical protein n=1 Tax=Sporomusa aerivorans TaxID=204936 RepID=UPI00352A0641